MKIYASNSFYAKATKKKPYERASPSPLRDFWHCAAAKSIGLASKTRPSHEIQEQEEYEFRPKPALN